MAKYPIYNPETQEATSPPIGAMSRAITDLSNLLNVSTATLTDEIMQEVYIEDTDRYRIFATSINKRGWLEDPSPIIKKNGIVINPVTDGFVINHMGGSVEFLNQNTRPTGSDVVTVTASYVTGTNSTVITSILDRLNATDTKLEKYRGSFDTLEQLDTSITDPQQYDYAFVFGTVFDIYFYDTVSSDWISVTQNDVDALVQRIVALENGKEPVISTKSTAFNKNFGTGNDDVMRGDYAFSKQEVTTAIATREPVIATKNTAFNKDFGFEANTVMQGNAAYSKSEVFTKDEIQENISNINLIDNSNLKINQRMLSEYGYIVTGSTRSYCIDRWLLNTNSGGNGKISINSNLITFHSGEFIDYLEQYISTPMIDGETYTISANIGGHKLQKSFTHPDGMEDTYLTDGIYINFQIGSNGYPEVRLVMENGVRELMINTDTDYIKLEQGLIATPHVSPNPILELIKCQNYYERGFYHTIVTTGKYLDTTYLSTVPFITEKRSLPTVTLKSAQHLFHADIPITNYTLHFLKTNAFDMALGSFPSEPTVGDSVRLEYEASCDPY